MSGEPVASCRLYCLCVHSFVPEILVNIVHLHAQEVYAQALRIVPHKLFSFSSLWIMFAQFEVRCKNLDAARSIFGNAIGRAPKAKIFEAYITLEMQLGNMERCRAIYEKYVPGSCFYAGLCAVVAPY